LQDCDKRRSERIAGRIAFALDKNVNDLVACTCCCQAKRLVEARLIALDLQSGVERLGDMIAESRIIVPFTGAGISTECGIPDFRSPGGIWTRNRPIPFDEFVAKIAEQHS